MYLPCFALMFFLSGGGASVNSTRIKSKNDYVILETKFGVNHLTNYSSWRGRLFKVNPCLLSVGDKRINLTLNKEFSFHALHHGENFLVSARYTF